MKYKGIIKNFEHFVVSDPHYLKDVWCRYDKKFDTPQDWNVELIIKDVDEMQEYKGTEFNVIGLDFSILIKRENIKCDLLDIGTIQYKKSTKLVDTEIGIDTAQVCMGVNEKADEINKFAIEINEEGALDKLFAEYNPPFAIQTMSDGTLGTVREGITNNSTDFILLTGFFDECAEVNSIEELRDYIVEQLNIESLEIQKESLKEEIDLDQNI